MARTAEEYATWAVQLWLDNEERTHKYVLAMARAAKRDADGDMDAARYSLAQSLKEEHEEGADDMLSKASVYGDLLGYMLASCDWYSVADSYLEMVSEEEE